MPTVTENRVTAYAHCGTLICPGNEQVSLEVVKRDTEYTYMDRGGDLPGVESSKFELTFLTDEDGEQPDAPCPHCGQRRELSIEPRKQYAALSGYDPNYLKEVAVGAAPAFDPTVVNTDADERVAAQDAKIAQLTALVEALTAEKDGG